MKNKTENNSTKSKSKKLYRTKEGHFIDLHNSKLFNPRLLSKSNSDEDNSIRELAMVVYNSSTIETRKKMSKVRIMAIDNILSNVIKAHKVRKVVAISKKADFFKGYRRHGLKHYTYNLIMDALKALVHFGYIIMVNGFHPANGEKGYRTRIWATEKLVALLELDKNTLEVSSTQTLEFSYSRVTKYSYSFYEVSYTNPIILKDKEKQIVNYRPTKSTIRMLEQLKEYNALMEQTSITIPGDALIKEYTKIEYNILEDTDEDVYN